MTQVERLRAQAERCWKLAILVGDPSAAKTLVSLAEKYFEQANSLDESGTENVISFTRAVKKPHAMLEVESTHPS